MPNIVTFMLYKLIEIRKHFNDILSTKHAQYSLEISTYPKFAPFDCIKSSVCVRGFIKNFRLSVCINYQATQKTDEDYCNQY